MDFTDEIVKLYNNVFNSQKNEYSLSVGQIKGAIKDINEAYSRNPNWQYDPFNKETNFNSPAHRCAYLHKYAMIHSGLMCEILYLVFSQPGIKRQLNVNNTVNLCSIGGGPGTEIVSLLFILQKIFGSVRCSIDVIDYSLEWKEVFESIISQLKSGQYGEVKSIVSSWYFNYEYLSANMINMSAYDKFKVMTSVKNADLVTMIKFISAVACDKTKFMIKKIFQTMKPGAMLLFVDNAAGGFDKMIRQVAMECGMVTLFGPLQHYDYENPRFALERYNCTSQYKTRVAIQMWKKPHSLPYNATAQLQREYMSGPSRGTRASASGNITFNSRETEEGCCSIM